MITKEKQRAQVKSKFYYIFWGIATFSVVAGQVYVGTSYRAMSRSLNKWFDTAIESLIPDPEPKGIYQPLVPPPYGDFRDYGNGVVFLNEN